MARGTLLSDLLTQLRAETGQSTVAAAGIDNKPSLVQAINRVQEVLFDDFNWPFKRVMPYLSLMAGTRYYDLPATIDFEHIVDVAVWYSGRPQRIDKGITYEQYNMYSSDDDERSGPVMRWDIKYIGSPTNREQLEVWPIPDDSSQKLQFNGTTKLVKMVADSDRAVLDDSLIVLTAAAEILARQKSEDAPLKQKMARARYAQLRAKYAASSAPFIMGGGVNPPDMTNRGKTIIIAR